MVIYTGFKGNKKYFVRYVEDERGGDYSPFTLVLTKNSVTEESLSQLEKVSGSNPLVDKELKFIFGKFRPEKVEKVVFVE